MTNYNDGKWHGWNGGECPVHPESVGDVTYYDGSAYTVVKLSQYDWYTPLMFRVIKEYRDPREFWLWDGEAFENEDDAKRLYLHNTKHNPELKGKPIIHVREVQQ